MYSKSKQVELERFKYAHLISIVKGELKKINVIPESEIDIYLDYPFGWHAAVGANDRVYVFTSWRGKISLSCKPVYGFGKNGKLILK